LNQQLEVREPVQGSRADTLLFHLPEYVERVEALSQAGVGMLDPDTPVFKGIYEAALVVVGTVLAAVEAIMTSDQRRAFVPIAGLHHARREGSAGFCVFNDCGIAINALRARHGVQRMAYVDIDAHHGDGVFYAFEEDPGVAIADLHESGRYLYPGSGDIEETGRGEAAGTKLNIPLPPGAGDELFFKIWPTVENFVEQSNPELIILQCGADSLAGDPITDLAFTSNAHFHAAQTLCRLAERKCKGRILALGGGGYNRENLAAAWTRVVRAMLETGSTPARSAV
jgi:acetoin utilization protein AcuC